MKTYIKNGIVKKKNAIVIHKDGSQIINPPHELLIECGWEEYTTPELTDEQKLDLAKQIKIDEVNLYDKSLAVESFSINGMDVWLDKATRAGLKLRFEAENAMNITTTSLWYNGQKFELSLENAIHMLYALEVYASQCYDNTQLHLANIEKIETKEELDVYDYRTGYPEKLRF